MSTLRVSKSARKNNKRIVKAKLQTRIRPTEHPHIVRRQGVRGGSPVIRGTRIAVYNIAILYKMGDTADDILASYPHLERAAVYDALSYYFDHVKEIEQEIRENQIENVLSKQGAVLDERGFITFPRKA